MRATAFGLVVIFASASLGVSILEASSQSPVTNSPPVSATAPSPSERLTDKLYPKWKLANVPDLSKPIFLKKGSRVCRADGPLMISAIVGGNPHFLFQDKDCEVVDAEIGVQVMDRCAGENVTCNSLYRFQEKFAVVLKERSTASQADSCTRCVYRKPRQFDLKTVSLNLGDYGRADIPLLEPDCLALQVQEPT
jgi:hypothetical protein